MTESSKLAGRLPTHGGWAWEGGPGKVLLGPGCGNRSSWAGGPRRLPTRLGPGGSSSWFAGNIPRSAKPYGPTQLVRPCDKALVPLSSIAEGLALTRQVLLPTGGWMLWPTHEAGQKALTTNTRLFQGWAHQLS